MLKLCILLTALATVIVPLVVFTTADSVEEDEINVNAPKCGGDYNKTSFEFKAPGNITSNTDCTWHIAPLVNRSAMPTFEIFVILRILHLEDDDKVTFYEGNSTLEPIFGPFSGQNDAMVILTGEENITITLETSSKETFQRKFDASYYTRKKPDGACNIAVPDSVISITSPVYKTNRTDVKCTYSYNKATHDANMKTFIFDKFSFSSSKSSVQVHESMKDTTFNRENPPYDVFSRVDSKLTAFEITLDPSSPNDTFRLISHEVNTDCSGYMSVKEGTPAILKSPKPSKLINITLATECRWLLEIDSKSTVLGLDLGALKFDSVLDTLAINDGRGLLASPLLQVTLSTINRTVGQVIRSSGQYMFIAFKPESFSSSFAGNVSVHGQGGTFKGNGTIKMEKTTGNDTAFLLEVNSDQNVLLLFTNSEFKPPAALHVYEDFSRKKLIATLHGNVWYPVLSPSSKMMLIAEGFNNGQFEAEFKGVAPGCMHMSPPTGDTYVLSGNCNNSCVWIIPPLNEKNSIVLLDFQYVSLSAVDEINIFYLNNSKSLLAKITSNVSFVPKFAVDASVGALVNVTRGNCQKTDEVILIAKSTVLPGCSDSYTLTPNQKVHLTSPSFPNTYPLHAECHWSISRSQKTNFLHIAFNKLQLASNHCIKITQLQKDKNVSSIIYGNQMPNDFLFQIDASVEFNSINCNDSSVAESLSSGEGFALNVTSYECGGMVNAKKSQLGTKNNTACLWIVKVPEEEPDGSVNIVTFSVSFQNKAGNFEFFIYDGASVRNETIKNTSSEIWSRTNTVIFLYRRLNTSAPSTEVIVNYNTKSCNESNQCDNKLCLHPDWRCNGVNDCGDYSDEKKCEAVPIPPNTKGDEGVSRVTLGISMVAFFALGIILACITPRLIEKYRNSQYRQFRDMPVGD